MSQNNAAENTTAAAAVAEPKMPSKMDKAKTLFAELKTATLAEGDSIRKQFIKRGQEEIGLTKAGAITYYNNLKSQDAGGKLYPHTSKKAAVASTTPETPAATDGDQKDEEAGE